MDGRTVVIQQPTTTAVAVQSNAPGAKTVTATRGLGITQIILGSLTILFGIIATAVLHYWVGSVGFGIWGGIWVCFTPIYHILHTEDRYCCLLRVFRPDCLRTRRFVLDEKRFLSSNLLRYFHPQFFAFL